MTLGDALFAVFMATICGLLFLTFVVPPDLIGVLLP